MKEELQPEEEKGETKISKRGQGEPLEYDDEINLLDLFMVLVRRKWLIISIVFLTSVAAVAISLLMKNIYRSEATIIPREEEKTPSSVLSSALGGLGSMVAGELGLGGAGSLEKLEVVFRSRRLAQRAIEKYDLMPVLFPDEWDERTKKWKTRKWFGLADMNPPTVQDAMIKMSEDWLSVTSDSTKGTLKASFDHRGPETARNIVDYFLIEMSEMMREVVLRDAAENIRFLTEQLDKTTDPLLRIKICESLAREIEKDTFARAQKYYGFYVADPPFAPDLDKQAKPKRALIFILSIFVAFFIAIFLAFLLEFVSRVKKEDPDRYQELRNGLRLRRKRPRQSKEQGV
jgi:uncharacterized protein involved in exopolysaccharide biosynthesis